MYELNSYSDVSGSAFCMLMIKTEWAKEKDALAVRPAAVMPARGFPSGSDASVQGPRFTGSPRVAQPSR